MKYKLLSYTDVKFPLAPYTTEYIIGIVENKDGKRMIVHVDKGDEQKLEIGIEGSINTTQTLNGIINIFTPNNKENATRAVRKVALVTGGTRGIGKAISLELAKEGYDIVVNSSKDVKENMEVISLIKNMGRKCEYIQADVSDFNQVSNMISKVIDKMGGIDVLINNAGITIDKKLEDMTPEMWNKVIGVNLSGVFNCSQLVIKYMKKCRSGRIINLSSIVGEIGNIGQSNYSASKGGIIAFTKTIAKEYAKDGITVNSIAPGFIKTQMMEGIPKGTLNGIISQIPLGRLGEPEEIAKLVGYLVSDDAKYITGQVININGGLFM